MKNKRILIIVIVAIVCIILIYMLLHAKAKNNSSQIVQNSKDNLLENHTSGFNKELNMWQVYDGDTLVFETPDEMAYRSFNYDLIRDNNID